MNMMPNPEHLETLNRGVETWNKWRELHPKIQPYLLNADLIKRNLEGINFEGAYLHRANLAGANLYGAKLYKAELVKVSLNGANLTSADLRNTNLSHAYLIALCTCMETTTYATH